jgi:D-alanyl-D-alanine carboxypeptidase
METGSGTRHPYRWSLGLPGRGSRRGARTCGRAHFSLLVAMLAGASLGATRGSAAPALVIDAQTGGVLYASEATVPWYPASLTKLMTAYVALEAARAHRISLDTPLAVSARANAAPPSKMGFRPGTLVTLDNALKMLMVKSANDIAVTIAEGVSGSVEAFAQEMNVAAARLGMAQSHFVNPNGLPDPRHVSSARDMALLAQALVASFPEHKDLYSIAALRLGDDIIKNHNHMLGRYPGADGMKTGFTCPAGFNLVASATRDGRKVIAVVLGAPNVELRTARTAVLFDRAFAGIDRPSVPIATLPMAGATAPPDMRTAICRKPAAAVAAFVAENDRLAGPLLAAGGTGGGLPYAASLLTSEAPMASRIALVPQLAVDPVPVFVGAPEGYVGLVARARPAHSPIGTEGPPDTAQAFAAAGRSPLEAEGSPVAPDHAALPMKGHRRTNRAAQARKAVPRHPVVANVGKGDASQEKPVSAAVSRAGKPQAAAVPKPPARPERK